MNREKQYTPMTGILLHRQEQDYLELNNVPLQCGDSIEVRIIGYWITGSVERDGNGWYARTKHNIGIRLHPGLTVRLVSPLALAAPGRSDDADKIA